MFGFSRPLSFNYDFESAPAKTNIIWRALPVFKNISKSSSYYILLINTLARYTNENKNHHRPTYKNNSKA